MMRFRLIYVAILLCFVLTSSAGAQDGDFPVLKGPYLGQEPPGNTPVKFPFDFMPDGYKLHSAPAFTPDGKEVYFSAMDFSIRFSEKIFVMKISEGIWGPPEVAPFSGDFFDGSPSISRDGEYLFFSSARTRDQRTRNREGNRNIWFVKREGETWSSPKPLGFQTSAWENGSDLSARGNLFFDSKDIYQVKFSDDSKLEPVRLGNAVNSDDTELHPCIAPDEQFLIFYSSRPGHFGSGGGDLYISIKDEDGNWQQAMNLGEKFNEGHLSTSFPRLSPDGKYFFFLKLISVPWIAEVYWVSSEALDVDNLQTRKDDELPDKE
jgi:Tol biopolymer transport system component